MLSLIWGLLNIALYLFSIFLCVKITKYIHAKIGTFAAIVFVGIILSSASRADKGDENLEPRSNQIKTWDFVPKDSTTRGNINLKEKIIDDELIEHHSLGIQYTIDENNGQPIPISGYSEQTGFVSGKGWQPMAITINKTLDVNLFRYSVDGITKWKLLGITLYAQGEHYDGVISLKDVNN